MPDVQGYKLPVIDMVHIDMPKFAKLDKRH